MPKKKNFDEQLTEAEAAGQNPAASYRTAEKNLLKMVSLYVDPELYEAIQDLAQYRAAMGEKNLRGQPYSAAAILNEAAAEYIERNRETLEAWREARKSLPGLSKK